MADKAPAEKSAADILIEMQLEEKRLAAINPLAREETPVKKGEKHEDGAAIDTRHTYANGAIVETYK